MECRQCGGVLSEEARFCLSCGAARESDDSKEQATTAAPSSDELGRNNRGRELRWSVITLALIVGGVGAIAWNVPTSQSDLKHHDANNSPFLSSKAYDEGADFYIFNRCSMFVLVDGKKYSFPGEEQNDSCVFANPADALKIAAYIRAGD